MDDIHEHLSTVAEFSIGLAGFAGIVAVLSRYDSADLALIRFRFTNLLVTSFAPGFFTLLTFSLTSSSIATEPALRISSGVLTVYLCAWAAFVLTSTPPGASRGMLSAMATATVANVAIQLASATGLSTLPATSYLTGLILLLLQGAVVFAALALAALRSSRDARQT